MISKVFSPGVLAPIVLLCMAQTVEVFGQNRGYPHEYSGALSPNRATYRYHLPATPENHPGRAVRHGVDHRPTLNGFVRASGTRISNFLNRVFVPQSQHQPLAHSPGSRTQVHRARAFPREEARNSLQSDPLVAPTPPPVSRGWRPKSHAKPEDSHRSGSVLSSSVTPKLRPDLEAASRTVSPPVAEQQSEVVFEVMAPSDVPDVSVASSSQSPATRASSEFVESDETVPEEGETDAMDEDTDVVPKEEIEVLSPEKPEENEHPFAIVTETEGQVVSPYLPRQILDVTGMRSGELAIDPRNDKLFQVP